MEKDTTLRFGLDQIEHVADFLYALRDHCKVYAFKGTLGAGKTTLSQKLLRRFGVEGVITSPTFTYVNMYHLNDGTVLYHFDLYRINSVDEFVLSGFNEYLYQPNSWALIEWPEVIEPLLMRHVVEATLAYEDEHTRELKVKVLN
ncbi:MAG: tRNA (adenosine(37)-N6)-threonylcarbamoyltransferase complex ATPase subunit type 1 TsaE [Candidatus Babeliales bacterium]